MNTLIMARLVSLDWDRLKKAATVRWSETDELLKLEVTIPRDEAVYIFGDMLAAIKEENHGR